MSQVYVDVTGRRWVEDPNGKYGWYSVEAGGEDGGLFDPWVLRGQEDPHGTPIGDGGILRYYSPVPAAAETDLRAQLEAVTAERDRYIAENRTLWARLGHIVETAEGKMTPPEIAEIRRVRGLDPL